MRPKFSFKEFFHNLQSEAQHKTGIIVGIVISVIGILFHTILEISLLISLMIVLLGKVVIFMSIFEHAKYRRIVRGEHII